MYSGILAASCDTTHDDETESDIVYCSSAGKDSYTEAGTWITYNGKESSCGSYQLHHCQQSGRNLRFRHFHGHR